MAFQVGRVPEMESEYQSRSDLARHGWVADRSARMIQDHSYSHFRFSSMLSALQIDATCGEMAINQIVKYVHSESKSMNKYPTDAYYTFGLNPQQLFMCALDSKSPSHMSSSQADYEIPNLQKWSDIAFLAWKDSFAIANKERDKVGKQNLSFEAPKYILRAAIHNDRTQDTIAAILTASRRASGEGSGSRTSGKTSAHDGWGHRIRLNSPHDAFYALLKSANGSGVAGFLMSHKEAFGAKTVKEISVFTEGGQTHTLLEIEAVKGNEKE